MSPARQHAHTVCTPRRPLAWADIEDEADEINPDGQRPLAAKKVRSVRISDDIDILSNGDEGDGDQDAASDSNQKGMINHFCLASSKLEVLGILK